MDGVLGAVGALQHQLVGPAHLQSQRSLPGRHERQSSVASEAVSTPGRECGIFLPDKGSTTMTWSRRDLRSASALLLAGPGAALRAAGKEGAVSGETPIVLCWN